MAERPPFIHKPIELQTHLMLEDTDRYQIGPREVTISSSGKFLCVRTPVALTVIDLQNTSQRRRWFERSDLAHVNSSGGSIVVHHRGALEARIFPAVEQGMENVKEHTFPNDIVFLKWISDNVVAIVTTTTVYHWSTEDQEPKKMFDRNESTMYTNIIDYRTDATQNMLLLTGCRRGTKPLSSDGFMELYSVDSGERRTIDGQAGAFSQFKMDGNQELSTLFCYVIRYFVKPRIFSPKSLATLSNVVLSPESTPPETNLCRLYIEIQQEIRHVIPVDFDPETQMDDYPVGIQVGPKYDVIYLMTRVGYVYVYLTESGVLLCKERASMSKVFVTAPHEPSSGIIAVNLQGQVFSVCIKEERFISYINNVLGLPHIALRLANKHIDLPGAEELIRLHQASHRLSSQHQQKSPSV